MQMTCEVDIWPLYTTKLTSACVHTYAHRIEQSIVKTIIGIFKKDYLKNLILIILVTPSKALREEERVHLHHII